ncbi:GlxA family transcriptional regulator [uncultured Hoeflea sp.]|uniref:GlxA family transcriptional regulator n=1 Tax=uncultured Hoeflea sp. TaxID=538666 RepID=UPI00260C897C|nr:GlxA family transcriptional regulator [uncultured Hoeflea sp.]
MFWQECQYGIIFRQAEDKPILVRFLLYPDVTLLDVAGPAQVFEAAARVNACCSIDLEFCTPAGGRVSSDTGLMLDAKDSLTLKNPADIFIVPGSNALDLACQDTHLINEIIRHAHLSKITASVCTGSLLLARAGLLTDRRAATHWRFAADFAELFPQTRVDPDQIYVQDGNIWTSAGVSAGIDMALALVAAGFGRNAAVTVARELVVPLIRSGGQKQFSKALEMQTGDGNHAFGDLHDWIGQNLDADLRVDALASRCGMSSRSFARKHVQLTGVTPARMVENLRIELCAQLLESSSAPVKAIASDCGFASVNNMRLAFKRHKGVDPTTYRKQFGPR